FSGALELLQFHFDKSACRGIAAHDGIAGRGPGEDEAGIVGFAAHGVVAGAETSADDHGNLGHDAIGNRVDHFCASAFEAAPLGVVATHDPVDVVQKNEREAVLVEIEYEAGGFFGRLGVDDAAELDALLVGPASQRLPVFFLVGDDADGPAAD